MNIRRTLMAFAMGLWVHSNFALASSPGWLTAHDAEIKTFVSQMTLAEKVGQMTQPNVGALKDLADIRELCLGSVLNGGSTDPKTGNHRSDWTRLYLECQTNALQTRLAIPLLYGIDAVHGHNNVLGAVIFPHNIGLGCTRDAALVERVARVTAREVRATGIQWTFAPSVAVPRDVRWGRAYEGFSEEPAVVAELGAAAVRGLQGSRLDAPDSVLACAKHFIGDGGTRFELAGDRVRLDQGDAQMDEATLRAVHLHAYRAAIAAGVGSIMPSYSSWNGVKCSANRFLLTDLLKHELGFQGLLVSDYNAIDQIVPSPVRTSGGDDNAFGQVRARNYKQCVEISINAGMDMVMLTDRYREFIVLTMELVREGRIPMGRIDDAVTRILRAKFGLGLLPHGAPLDIDPALPASFGSPEHRAVARQAVRESMVLLKNERGTLPLRPTLKRIHVAGRGADDLGMQCGGWTIDWQGKPGAVTEGGTTLLAALRQQAGRQTEVTYSIDGSGAAGADVGIVIVGERPYAEGKGDRENLALAAEDLETVAKVKAAGLPVVVVILSGRPLLLGPVVQQANAIVAAWLPGTEGGGVADVLWGLTAPTGKLSFTWPRTMNQVPRGNGGRQIENPEFPFGFGLSY
jgi:beta-glucosidase